MIDSTTHQQMPQIDASLEEQSQVSLDKLFEDKQTDESHVFKPEKNPLEWLQCESMFSVRSECD